MLEEKAVAATLTLTTILEQVGFDEKQRKRIKFVRHPLSNPDIRDIYNKGMIEAYQSEQDSEIFKNCDYVLGFIGEGGNSARFMGCYKIGDKVLSGKEKEAMMPKGFPKEEYFKTGVYYDLQKTDILKDLQDRLVVKWNNPIAWHQWGTNDMQIISISPRITFPGYEKVTLMFKALSEVIEEKNADWLVPLSKVGGIYLITTPNGLYVGSAYGKEGIWDRWSEYVKTKHGNNKEMIDLVEKNPGIYHDFRFSLLKVIPKKSTDDEVIAWENFFKIMLNTRNREKWGLNAN